MEVKAAEQQIEENEDIQTDRNTYFERADGLQAGKMEDSKLVSRVGGPHLLLRRQSRKTRTFPVSIV